MVANPVPLIMSAKTYCSLGQGTFGPAPLAVPPLEIESPSSSSAYDEPQQDRQGHEEHDPRPQLIVAVRRIKSHRGCEEGKGALHRNVRSWRKLTCEHSGGIRVLTLTRPTPCQDVAAQ